MNDSQKIEELLHYFRMEQKDFAAKCGFEPSIISHIKKGKIGISMKVFSKIISTFPEVNKEWLLSGEGEMLNNSVKQSIIGNNNIQGGDNSIVDSNNGEYGSLIREKDKLLAEKDKLLYEKDERIKELKDVIQDLKEIIRELKSK